MDKFFAVFGKMVLVLLVVGVLAGGGYYVGTKYNFFGKNLSVTPTPQDQMAPEPTSRVAAPESSPPSTPTQIVQGGVPPSGGLSFFPYTLNVPTDWIVSHESDTSVPVDTVTLTKGDYQIKIFQAATGGAMCLYPGDPAFEGPSSAFDTFETIILNDGTVFRRSGTIAVGSSGKRGFTLCQKSSDGTFQQPTPFGHVSYTTPVTPDTTILNKMDGIISSFAKM